jgi:putative MATE family efflux protein
MKLLTKGNAFKVLFKFSIPLIISGLLVQTYNLVDLIIAGKCIGDDALSATGCTTTFIQFASSLFWGFGVAVGTVCGQYFGSNEKEKIINVIKSSIILDTLIMFFICVACVLLSDFILQLLKVDQLIFENAKIYFCVYLCALFFQSIYYQIDCILQSLGNSRYQMITTIVSCLINIIFNLVFVLVFNLGVLGLALASVLSSLVGLVMGLIKICLTIKELGGKYNISFNNASLKPVYKIALPCILQQSSLYLSSLVVQPFINGLGKDVSAGYSIAMNINLFFNSIYHGVARAVASYSSQSKGEKLYKNYSKGIGIGLLQQIILCLPFAIICFIIPNEVCSIFLNTKDSACLPYATQFIYLCLPFLVFICIGNLMHSFYKSVGAVKSVLISTIIFTIARIVLTYVLPNTSYLFSVYLALSLAWVVEAIVLGVIYFTRIWQDKDEKEALKNNKSKVAI